jgi:hypothetical protein
MSLEYIFPDHTKRNHNIAIAVEVTLAVFGLILIFWAISHYWVSPKEVVEVSVEDPVALKMKIIEQKSTIELSPEEISLRRSIIEQTPPKTTQTPQDIEKKKSIIQNI